MSNTHSVYIYNLLLPPVNTPHPTHPKEVCSPSTLADWGDFLKPIVYRTYKLCCRIKMFILRHLTIPSLSLWGALRQ